MRTMGGWAGAVEAYLAVDRSEEVHGTVDASSGELVVGPDRRGGGGQMAETQPQSRTGGTRKHAETYTGHEPAGTVTDIFNTAGKIAMYIVHEKY